jgi:ABC-type nitrate/sulfonate/bicarbonate transport system substrate-binding protein
MKTMLQWVARSCALVALSFAAGLAGAADPATVRVKVFPGAQNLAIFTGLAKGIFEKHDLKVELQFTANSSEQRKGLADGAFEIAHAAVDNAVAMVELAGKDVIIVMGGDSSMNEFFVQPDIQSVKDLRGKVVLVDAPNTAYALLAKKILLTNGLKEGADYTVKPVGGTPARLRGMTESKEAAAAVINLPYSLLARQRGLKSLGRTVDLLGPYQATGAFVMRAWAQANGPVLERYIAAYVESVRLALQPSNRDESAVLLAQRLQKVVQLTPEEAGQAYDLLKDPKFGLTPDAKFDLEGFKNVLALRAEIEGSWGGKPPAPDKYFDLSYYQRAVAALGR